MTDTVRVVSVGGGEGSAQPPAGQGGPHLGESRAEGAQMPRLSGAEDRP